MRSAVCLRLDADERIRDGESRLGDPFAVVPIGGRASGPPESFSTMTLKSKLASIAMSSGVEGKKTRGAAARVDGSTSERDAGAAGGPADRLARSRLHRPAVFLDRDGVLNVDKGYVHAPHQVEWVEGAKEAVKLLNDAGYYVFVITNQAGVAKGLYEEPAIETLHAWMANELAKVGASIDDWRYCPFHPEGQVAAYRAAHPWRKPEPGMILDLFDHWPIERDGSFLVGDRLSDIEAAEAAGLPGWLFEGGDLLAFMRDRLRSAQGNRGRHGTVLDEGRSG
jgi:D-glycero-D-manno-heptose 1,7-bisphosphate phosphatase